MSTEEILEKKVEQELVDAVESLGGECLKLEVKGRRGWPDRLCLLPEGITICVEVKRRSGQLSKAQEARLRTLHHMGHLHVVVWDIHQVNQLAFMMQKMIHAAQSTRSLRGGMMTTGY